MTFDPNQHCRGSKCDRLADCSIDSTCHYRSSADEARAVRATEMFLVTPIKDTTILRHTEPGIIQPVSHLERAPEPVKDFEGSIDGKGIKNVMFSAKSPLQLITPEILEGLAGVLLHGAKKYAANNWMRGMSWETVMGGVLRHLTAFRRGEEMDPESGLPHLHHAACGIMFLSWYANGPQRTAHEAFDDRGYKTTGTPCE